MKERKAQSKASKPLLRVGKGGKVAGAGKPVARLSPGKIKKTRVLPGFAKGSILYMAPDFDDPD